MNPKTGRMNTRVVPSRILKLSANTLSKYPPWKENAITYNRIPQGNYYTYKRGNTKHILTPNTLLKLLHTHPAPGFRLKTYNNNGYPLTINALKAQLRNLFRVTRNMSVRATAAGRASGNPLFVDPHTRTVVTNLNIGLKYKRGH
jgi:hypothetical protein